MKHWRIERSKDVKSLAGSLVVRKQNAALEKIRTDPGAPSMVGFKAREKMEEREAGIPRIQQQNEVLQHMRRDWIDTKQDRDEVAAILKGGRP